MILLSADNLLIPSHFFGQGRCTQINFILMASVLPEMLGNCHSRLAIYGPLAQSGYKHIMDRTRVASPRQRKV